jgi:hypothetical protein
VNKKLWLPNQYNVEQIGEAPPHLDLLNSNFGPDKEKTVIVKAKIIEAVYHREQGQLAIQVVTPDGKTRAVCLHKSSFKYNGRPFNRVTAEEVDKEMLATVEGFRKCRGKTIKIQMYESQLG